MTSTRALVVGGAGFIGSHLVERLVDLGQSVDVIDDLSTGSLANLNTARRLRERALSLHTLDACSPALGNLVGRRRPETIYHLAPASPDDPDDHQAVAAMLTSVINVLATARSAGVAKLVVALDAADLYGDIPVRDQPVKEGTRVESSSLAAVATRAIVELLTVSRVRHSLEFTALAFGEVYGPRQRAGTVAELLALGDMAAPDVRRHHDVLYIDDAVDALVRAGQRGSGLVANVASGQTMSRRDLVRAVSGLSLPPAVRSPVPTRVTRATRLSLSVVRARIHLGWEAYTSIAEGLAATVAWLDSESPRAGAPGVAPHATARSELGLGEVAAEVSDDFGERGREELDATLATETDGHGVGDSLPDDEVEV